MELILSFAFGYFINEGRILRSVFPYNLDYIKNRIIVEELGIKYLMFFMILNFGKGFIPFYLFSGISDVYDGLLAISILLGLFLGFKPIRPEGSELIVLLGIVVSYDLELFKISLAVFLSIFILTRNIHTSLLIIMFFNLVFLHGKNYYLFFIVLLSLVNFVRSNYALFSSLKNTIYKTINFFMLKGVKNFYESLLHSSTKFLAKHVEKGH